MISELPAYTRFAVGLPGFLGRRLTPAEARDIVAARLRDRERRFLTIIRRGIFERSGSPYRALFEQAACTFGDVERMVARGGLEPTLAALREAGVYVTFDEYKGRTPIVRGGKVIEATPRAFDNISLSRYYAGESGGSTGTPTRVLIDLDHLAATAATRALAWDTHRLLDAPLAMWRSMLPGTSGINNVLHGVRIGNVPCRWFTPVSPRDLRPSLRCRVAMAYVVQVGRACGVPIPRPEPVRLDEAGVIARWMAGALARHGRCVLSAFTSLAMRVSLAAAAEGIDLTGAAFTGGGEPPTPAKVAAITSTGARWVPNYAFTEAGPVGVACANPVDGEDVHFVRDSLALIPYPRQVPGSGVDVDAFCFTTLLPTAPKLLLNVESDDHGILERRACGCPLEAIGLVDHIRRVRSFSKLTGEGVTLIGSDVLRILEEELPRRFGGTALDYQLLEEEDERGFTRMALLVSPRVPVADETVMARAVLDALARGVPSADLARAIWTQAGTLRVRRAEPVCTARGKILPLRVERRAATRPPAAPASADQP